MNPNIQSFLAYLKQKLYINFNMGVFSIIFGFACFYLFFGFLGMVLFPFFVISGIAAIIIAEVHLVLKFFVLVPTLYLAYLTYVPYL